VGGRWKFPSMGKGRAKVPLHSFITRKKRGAASEMMSWGGLIRAQKTCLKVKS